MYVIEVVKDKSIIKLRVINLDNFNLIYDTVVVCHDIKSFDSLKLTEMVDNKCYIAKLFETKDDATISCEEIANQIRTIDTTNRRDHILSAISNKSNEIDITVIPSLEEEDNYDEEVYDKTLIGSN